MESNALSALRKYEKYEIPIETALDAVMLYSEPLQKTALSNDLTISKAINKLRVNYERTLLARPWENCDCELCRKIGIESLIFRGSNRNKRRGIHNLAVYHKHLQRVLKK